MYELYKFVEKKFAAKYFFLEIVDKVAEKITVIEGEKGGGGGERFAH